MCANYEDIFTKGVGDAFFCQFDQERWNAAAHALEQLR
jgi:hypothetical protein